MAEPKKAKQLGEILVDSGMITQEQLEQALEEHNRVGKLLGRVLIDMKLIKENDLVRALALQVGLEFVDLTDYKIEPWAPMLLPENVARRYRALPIGERDGKLLVAMSDPANVYALDDIRIITGREVHPVVATASDIEQALRKYAGLDQQVEELAEEVAQDTDEMAGSEGEAAAEEAPIVKLVNAIMSQAVGDRASDIHIEPAEKDVRIRFRVDGVLHEVMHSPKKIQGGLISRLKVMADMDLAEKRIPQDGRIAMRVQGRTLDLRVVTLPILDKSSALMHLEDLGFLESQFQRYETAYRKPYGAILVTGPTGAGKSTTLYATLNILNKPDRNIITVEDPVEYRLRGINQVQVHNQAGLTFSVALRSILRNSPDIILVGEIRDRESAMIAVESALTGHLVLSSLHTNDAPSAITRLVEMQVEPFLVASAIDCVVAQRLARKLCEKCKEVYKPDAVVLRAAGYPEEQWPEIEELWRPVGCSACSKTGYRGRMGLYEVMLVSEEIEKQTVEHASAEDIKKTAVAQGMYTLRQDGLEKSRLGWTSIEDVLRVVA
jgi:type IV pilus assembly protein PilB